MGFAFVVLRPIANLQYEILRSWLRHSFTVHSNKCNIICNYFNYDSCSFVLITAKQKEGKCMMSYLHGRNVTIV